MNSEQRFYLIQRLEEKLDIKFTDIQLDFLMDDRSQLALMSRQTGKDLLLRAKVAISIVEHCLDEKPYYIGMFCLENTFMNVIELAEIERNIDMLLPPYLKALNKDTNYNRTEATLIMGRVKLSIRPRVRQFGNMSEIVGARFHEVYINEFGTSLSATKDLVDVAIMCTLEFEDNRGGVHIVGTPRLGLTEEDVDNTFSSFVIKKAPGLQMEEPIGVGTISIDGMSGTITADRISIGRIADDVLTTVPRQETEFNGFFTTPEEWPTLRFNNAGGEAYIFQATRED